MPDDFTTKLADAIGRKARDYSLGLDGGSRAVLEILEGCVREAVGAESAEQFWIGPFEWEGGPCPLPPDVMVNGAVRCGEFSPAREAWRWHWLDEGKAGDVVSFRYLAYNPEGWLLRPEGWVPPDEAWPLEWRSPVGVGRLSIGPPWHVITHIRLLPREKASEPEPAPIPADTRALVREALEAVDRDWLAVAPKGPSPALDGSWNKVRQALAALDAVPAEKVEALPPGCEIFEGCALSLPSGAQFLPTADDLPTLRGALEAWLAELERQAADEAE